ncbi:MAG: GDP-mannose 4,6-dehydratase, partial [Candidatus Omnitrophica bacterium]|nr:GDP-mannose 4,6-dehydratase [Candidatus Omnitrophota bacterium]
QFVFGNVCNSELVSKVIEQCDTVVHMAAESHVSRSIFDNLLFYETDVLGTHSVTNAIVEHGKHIERFIHFSTSEVYGTAITPVMTEEHPLLPSSPYASAKAGADRLVYSYWCTYGIPAVILRPFNQYGSFQHLEKMLPRFITSCVLNESITVHGDGKQTRSFCYVSDLVKGILKLMKSDCHEPVNLGNPVEKTILALAEKIKQITGSDSEVILKKLPLDDPKLRRPDVSKAKEKLGWIPEVSLDDGLKRTVEWFENKL